MRDIKNNFPGMKLFIIWGCYKIMKETLRSRTYYFGSFNRVEVEIW